MTQKSNLIIAVVTFVGCFMLLALRPVPASSLQNVKSTTGKVVRVSEDLNSDLVLIKLGNDKHTYAILQETDNSADFAELKNNLLYRKATLEFVGPRSTLDMVNQKIPVARIMVSGQTFWKQPTARFAAN